MVSRSRTVVAEAYGPRNSFKRSRTLGYSAKSSVNRDSKVVLRLILNEHSQPRKAHLRRAFCEYRKQPWKLEAQSALQSTVSCDSDKQKSYERWKETMQTERNTEVDRPLIKMTEKSQSNSWALMTVRPRKLAFAELDGCNVSERSLIIASSPNQVNSIGNQNYSEIDSPNKPVLDLIKRKSILMPEANITTEKNQLVPYINKPRSIEGSGKMLCGSEYKRSSFHQVSNSLSLVKYNKGKQVQDGTDLNISSYSKKQCDEGSNSNSLANYAQSRVFQNGSSTLACSINYHMQNRTSREEETHPFVEEVEDSAVEIQRPLLLPSIPAVRLERFQSYETDDSHPKDDWSLVHKPLKDVVTRTNLSIYHADSRKLVKAGLSKSIKTPSLHRKLNK